VEDPPPPSAAWPPSTAAAPPSATEAPPPVLAPPVGPPGAPGPDSLRRYRALQFISIALIFGGLAGLIVTLMLGGSLAVDEVGPESMGRALILFFALVVSGIALVSGLVMNAVRALVVREALPPSRYRGPSILVLLLLATIVA
jgi:hypothetical protein